MVCVNDDPDAFTRPGFDYLPELDGLTKGQIYTINKVFVDPMFNDVCVYIDEIKREIPPSEGYEPGYNIKRFRLLKVSKGFQTLEHIVKNPDMYKTIYVEYDESFENSK